jgi:hypothetical protein
MDKLHTLFSSGSADLGMAMPFARSVNCKVTSSEALRTKVGNADTRSEVQHCPAVSKGNIRARAFGHDALDLASKTGSDMFLAKANE